MVPGVDALLDRCADFLTFGAIAKCPKCKTGDMMFSKYGYTCSGEGDWAACANFIEKPLRMKSKIPSELKKDETSFFAKYKPKVEDRAVRPANPNIAKQLNKSGEIREPKVSRQKEPLYNMHIVAIGNALKKDDLKRDIERMGGKLVTKIQGQIAVVISTPDEVSKMNERMKLVKSFDIQVVPASFFESIKGGAPTQTIELIKSMSICSWGSDPLSRIPQEEARGEKESMYAGKASKVAVKLKNGTAIDPESGLEDVAHVYRHDGVLYTSVLSFTDIQKNKNSYYKLQVLQSDAGREYWVFRGWGRIGTKVGDTKLEKFPSAESACDQFETLFQEKTGNMFNGGLPFQKVRGKYYPVEVDYDDDEKVKKIVEKSKIPSKLPPPTRDLVNMLFDINTMKQTMLEFELDLDKMPLGRLSKKQLQEAYQVLKDLNELVSAGATNNEFIGLSNKFFTLVPHNFGMNKAPIIDTLEMIQTKRDILDNLIEVEIAYSMLQQDTGNELNPLDAHYEQLKTELKPLDQASEEFTLLSQYVKNTHAATHKEYTLEVMDVFAVSRNGENRRYKPFKKLHNRQLLWHGSRLTNYVGILSHGLKIAPPEAPVTGYMFGKFTVSTSLN
jgi:poly [ADP-ribose] polymerase 1